jgi:predicted heme/steroid binding protein
MKKFTREKLAQHNGKNENPTYVAYKGKVYGVSRASIQNRRLIAGRMKIAEKTESTNSPMKTRLLGLPQKPCRNPSTA